MAEADPLVALSEVEVLERTGRSLSTDPDIVSSNPENLNTGEAQGTKDVSTASMQSSDESKVARPPATATATTGLSHRSTFGSGPAMSKMTPTTHDAYGGGLYGMDPDGTSSINSATLGRASDFQSAEGLAADMPAHHVEHEPPSTGDTDRDITGQSYIQ